MDSSGILGSARPPKRARLSLQDFKCTPKIHHQDAASYQQIDGSGDYYQQGRTHEARPSIIQPSLPRTHSQSQPIRPQHHQAVTQVPSRPPYRKPESAVTDILPYCTTEPPLKQEQVIALSDVVGSVGELVLLALSAASGDRECAEVMESAVGAATASSIVDFFTEEWEVE
ncbi:hypothetical protein HBI24_158540 [Parastagonospora nodorum]|nr:hypothetical protein HBH46_022160 [Parastagonospora nodorum]KAH4163020.1 hypothetical protein HBH43_159560 [Parastagonospora nodorum]KAH4197377.1 hypothetical protein HBH42_056340 [Parastagonospora nodorum]KAH4994217.1 hypothetical protein HBI76_022840 [Parastagonospora nodorum]KAH5409456.1 hypothetical protein HBI46_174340 [Parastagonospora nodorum]